MTDPGIEERHRRRQALIDSNDADRTLVDLLTMMGDRWGAMGVALAAAQLTDPTSLVIKLSKRAARRVNEAASSRTVESAESVVPKGVRRCWHLSAHPSHRWADGEDVVWCGGVPPEPDPTVWVPVKRCVRRDDHLDHVWADTVRSSRGNATVASLVWCGGA